MHYGNDNYYLCNTQGIVPNLPKNDRLYNGLSLDNYKQFQDGRQTSNVNNSMLVRNNMRNTNGNLLKNWQRTPKCTWTSTVCTVSSRPYNYQNQGIRLQQKDFPGYWQNIGQRNIVTNGSDVPEPLNNNNVISTTVNNNNNISQKSQYLENHNAHDFPLHVARIRVKDVNSLNNLAQSSVYNNGAQLSRFDTYLNSSYNITHQRPLNPVQDNIEHANYIPSLFEVNPFQPSYEKPTAPPKPLVSRDRFANVFQKHKEPMSQFYCENLYPVSTSRQDESPVGRADSLLRDLLTFKETQMDVLGQADVPQINNRLNVPPNTTDDGELNLQPLHEGRYNVQQPFYRNSSSYAGSLRTSSISSATSQENSLPVTERISPPNVENALQSDERRFIEAVISLPDLSQKNVSKQISGPSTKDGNFTPASECNGDKTETGSRSTMPSSDAEDHVTVKQEPMFSSELLNESVIEIVIHTMKTENEEDNEMSKICSNNNNNNIIEKDNNKNNDTKKSTGNNGSNNTDNNKVSNHDSESLEIICDDRMETTGPQCQNKANTSETISLERAEPSYRSQINRDKLDMLIEFLKNDKKKNYTDKRTHSNKWKKEEKSDDQGDSKSKRPVSNEKSNAKEGTIWSVSSEVEKIEIITWSPELCQTVKNENSLRAENKPKEEKEEEAGSAGSEKGSENSGNVDKGKLKEESHAKDSENGNIILKNNDKKNKSSEKEKPKSKSLSKKDEGQRVAPKENLKSPEKSKHSETKKQNADVGRPEKYTEEETRFQDKQSRKSPTRDINENERGEKKDCGQAIKKELNVFSDPVQSVKNAEQMEKEGVRKYLEEGSSKANFLRILPNFNYHFCGRCNLVSPIDWFWINAVSGELKCLNCFKKMNLSSEEENYKTFDDEEGREKKAHKEDGVLETGGEKVTIGDLGKQSSQKVIGETSSDHSDETKNQRKQSTRKEEAQKEKRKSLEEYSVREKKEKRRKSDDKLEKKTHEQTSDRNPNKGGSHGVSECSKAEKSTGKSLSSLRSDERQRGNSLGHGRKSSLKDESVDPTRKRISSKEDHGFRKMRIIDEGEERSSQKCVKLYEVVKKVKESNGQKVKRTDDEEPEKKRRSPVNGERKDNKRTNPNENECHKSRNQLSEVDNSSKPLKEQQNTKVQSPSHAKQGDHRKPSEKEVVKPTKENGERKKREESEKKKYSIKESLQYKDFILSKWPQCLVTEVMEEKKIVKSVDVMKRNGKCAEKEDDNKIVETTGKLKRQ